MYGYYDGWSMMGWGGGAFGLLALITWLVWTGVGVLACVWLWKQIKK